MSKEIQISKHEFGPGVIPELATKLYRNPYSAIRESVSNALDAMVPFNEKKVEIRTNVSQRGDIEIEDWGTGIEDHTLFKKVGAGKKTVNGEVSSYDTFSEKIIGKKGMGKLSFLSLSDIREVEFYSNNGSLGMQIIMTIDGFSEFPKDSHLVLNHRGLKVVIKKATKFSNDGKKIIEYLSKNFALRIAGGAKIYVDNVKVSKPNEFDSHQFELFKLNNGIEVYGNLKRVEKPKTSNIDIFVKQVFAESKVFDYKVEGWLNCNGLELDTARENILEGNNMFIEFMNKLSLYLDKNFEKKSYSKDKGIKSEKQILKHFVKALSTINTLYPELNKPVLSGKPSEIKGLGEFSHIDGDATCQCSEKEGIVDKMQNGEKIIGKPIGNGKSHRIGDGESYFKIKKGDGKILSPSMTIMSGNGTIPEPKIIVAEIEEKPVVYFISPNRLIINQLRISSKILLDASSRDPQIKSRILPLLVRAALDAFPGSIELSKEEWFRKYDEVLDSVYYE